MSVRAGLYFRSSVVGTLILLECILRCGFDSVLAQGGPPFFSLDPASPSLPPDSAADIFETQSPPGFGIELPAGTLGLISGHNVDALSGPNNFVGIEACQIVILPAGNYTATLYAWSVDRSALGGAPPVAAVPALTPPFICIRAGLPIPPELPPQAPNEGAAGDVFLQVFDINNPNPAGGLDRFNLKWLDEQELGLADGLPATIDEIDALEALPFGGAFDSDDDQDPDVDVFFSVDPITAANLGRSPADILVRPAAAMMPTLLVYASESQLGLMPGDDIDALCVMEQDIDFGNGSEALVLSLAPGSPSLDGPDGMPGTSDDFSPGDAFRITSAIPFPGTAPVPTGGVSPLIKPPFLPHTFLSLEAGDNLDALSCSLGDPGGTSPPIDPLPGDGDFETGEWRFSGTAAGGEITVTLGSSTCQVTIATAPGESAEEVAARLGNAIANSTCALQQGFAVLVSGTIIRLAGPRVDEDSVQIDVLDPGIHHNLLAVPILSTWGILLLALVLGLAAIALMKRRA